MHENKGNMDKLAAKKSDRRYLPGRAQSAAHIPSGPGSESNTYRKMESEYEILYYAPVFWS